MTCRALALCFGLSLFAASCQVGQSFVEPEPGLERMLEQPRGDPFEGSSFHEDGMAMRSPPEGTIPVERRLGAPGLIVGIEAGSYVERMPMAIDRALIEHGRERFEILCAACHGVAGDGESVVAENMQLRKPPSLHEARIRALPAGRLYHVLRVGYGLMPSYAAQLSVEERWGVVAYVRALQLSRNARVAELPADVRAELEREAR